VEPQFFATHPEVGRVGGAVRGRPAGHLTPLIVSHVALVAVVVLAGACGASPDPTDVPLRDVFSVAPDGTGLRNLTRTPDVAETHVSASPDGSRLAFVRAGQLVVTDADGRGARRLAPLALGPELVAAPAWSPDGRRLAYTSSVGCGEVVCKTWEVWTVNVATGARRRIAADGLNPSWAPDGRRLVYAGRLATGTTARGEPTLSTNVVVVDLRSGRERDLGSGAWPSWAPRGERIAYLDRGRLFVVRADGRGERAVLSDATSTAVWAPDGRRVAFTRGLDDVFVVSTEGGRRRRIARGVGDPAAWSPDGRSLVAAAFVATRSESEARDDLVLVAPEGLAPTTIVRGAPNTRMESPTWTRRGQIVFATGLLS
jgi:Tol biopolymer transport system component